MRFGADDAFRGWVSEQMHYASFSQLQVSRTAGRPFLKLYDFFSVHPLPRLQLFLLLAGCVAAVEQCDPQLRGTTNLPVQCSQKADSKRYDPRARICGKACESRRARLSVIRNVTSMHFEFLTCCSITIVMDLSSCTSDSSQVFIKRGRPLIFWVIGVVCRLLRDMGQRIPLNILLKLSEALRSQLYNEAKRHGL
jgi:hypothetical protein